MVLKSNFKGIIALNLSKKQQIPNHDSQSLINC